MLLYIRKRSPITLVFLQKQVEKNLLFSEYLFHLRMLVTLNSLTHLIL